jgi:hypothetical protein
MPKSLFLRRLKAILMLIGLGLLSVPLASCQTLTTGTAAIAVACKTYGGAVTYSGSKDTAETIYEAKVHNKAFRNLGCKLD